MNQIRKKDRKPIYMLLCLFAIFCGFIYLITRRPPVDTLKESIEHSQTSDDIKNIWEKIKTEKLPEEKKKKLIQDMRSKLSTFDLSQKQTNEWINELKTYIPQSLNIIIIPNLSERITNDSLQIEDDIQIINGIWNIFKEYSKLKKNGKSRLIIEIADNNPKIADVINHLRFDLSAHKGAGISFFKEKEDEFKDNVRKLYKFPKEDFFGSDYVSYFNKNLGSHLKKSTLFDIYMNKIIIITDGYMKGIDNKTYTVIDSYRFQLYLAMREGNLSETIHNNSLNIPSADINLSNTDILICEVNEIDSGKGYDFEILKTYWEDWLNSMNAKQVVFFPKKNAIVDTNNSIKDFILQKN